MADFDSTTPPLTADPADVISIHSDLTVSADSPFQVDELRKMLVQIAVALNQVSGIGLSRRILTASAPITQGLLATAAHCEQTIGQIDAAAEQARQRSGLVVPGGAFGVMPGGRAN